MVTRRRVLIALGVGLVGGTAGGVAYYATRPTPSWIVEQPTTEAPEPVAAPELTETAGPLEPYEVRSTPRITGQRTALARQLARLTDLEYCQGTFLLGPGQWRPSIRPDIVYLQTPAPRLPLERGQLVAAWTFELALPGQSPIATPDVVGMPVEEAEQRLSTAGLQIMNPRPAAGSTTRPRGRVQEQYPRAGQSVFPRTSVFLRTM
ncbi:MAG: PASTA domain-containing protein [Pirellulales bacterium]